MAIASTSPEKRVIGNADINAIERTLPDTLSIMSGSRRVQANIMAE